MVTGTLAPVGPRTVGLDIVDFSSGVAPRSLADSVSDIFSAESLGYHRAWVPLLSGGPDPLLVCAAAAGATQRIGLATGVLRTWAHHPVELARAAVSMAQISHGRFTLGVGVSHRPVVEAMYGLAYTRPAAHLREYLTVLAGLLRQGEVDFHGEIWTARAQLDLSGGPPVPIVAAAGGPLMLAAAAEMADVVFTNMVGRRTPAEHTLPVIRRARRAGGDQAKLAVAVTICVTDTPREAARFIDETLAGYAANPDYKAMLAREGVDRPSEIAVVGSEEQVKAHLGDLYELGLDEIVASVKAPSVEEEEWTRQVVATLAR